MSHGRNKQWWVLLLRGLLGGFVGWVVIDTVAVFWLRPIGVENWLGFFILSAFTVLPFNLFLGLALGVMIWFFHRATGINLGLVLRMSVGIFAGIVAITIRWSLNSELLDTTPIPWIDLMGAALTSATLGGISGLVIGPQRDKEAKERSVGAM